MSAHQNSPFIFCSKRIAKLAKISNVHRSCVANSAPRYPACRLRQATNRMGVPPQAVGLRPKIHKVLEPVEVTTISRRDSEANTVSITVVARCPAGITIRVPRPASMTGPAKFVRHGTRTLPQRPGRASKPHAQTHKSTPLAVDSRARQRQYRRQNPGFAAPYLLFLPTTASGISKLPFLL